MDSLENLNPSSFLAFKNVSNYQQNFNISISEILNEYQLICSEGLDILMKNIRDNAHNYNLIQELELEKKFLSFESKFWLLLQHLTLSRLKYSNFPHTLDSKMFSPKRIILNAIENNVSFRENVKFLSWLEECNDLDIDGELHTLFNMPYSFLDNTKNIIKNAAQNSTLITFFDPDACTRQKRSISPIDREYEEKLLKCIFGCIRSGKMDKILEICKRTGQDWRYNSLQGYKLYHYEYESNDEIASDNENLGFREGNINRILWKNICWRMYGDYQKNIQYQTLINPYEIAVYGALCGNTKAVIPVIKCESWWDLLWVHMKTLVDIQTEAMLKQNPSKYDHLVNFGNGYNTDDKHCLLATELPNEYWNQINNLEDIFESVEKALHITPLSTRFDVAFTLSDDTNITYQTNSLFVMERKSLQNQIRKLYQVNEAILRHIIKLLMLNDLTGLLQFIRDTCTDINSTLGLYNNDNSKTNLTSHAKQQHTSDALIETHRIKSLNLPLLHINRFLVHLTLSLVDLWQEIDQQMLDIESTNSLTDDRLNSPTKSNRNIYKIRAVLQDVEYEYCIFSILDSYVKNLLHCNEHELFCEYVTLLPPTYQWNRLVSFFIDTAIHEVIGKQALPTPAQKMDKLKMAQKIFLANSHELRLKPKETNEITSLVTHLLITPVLNSTSKINSTNTYWSLFVQEWWIKRDEIAINAGLSSYKDENTNVKLTFDVEMIEWMLIIISCIISQFGQKTELTQEMSNDYILSLEALFFHICNNVIRGLISNEKIDESRKLLNEISNNPLITDFLAKTTNNEMSTEFGLIINNEYKFYQLYMSVIDTFESWQIHYSDQIPLLSPEKMEMQEEFLRELRVWLHGLDMLTEEVCQTFLTCVTFLSERYVINESDNDVKSPNSIFCEVDKIVNRNHEMENLLKFSSNQLYFILQSCIQNCMNLCESISKNQETIVTASSSIGDMATLNISDTCNQILQHQKTNFEKIVALINSFGSQIHNDQNNEKLVHQKYFIYQAIYQNQTYHCED